MSKIKQKYDEFRMAAQKFENAMQDEYPLNETIHFKRLSNQKNLSSGVVIGYIPHHAQVCVRPGPTKKSPRGFCTRVHINDIEFCGTKS